MTCSVEDVSEILVHFCVLLDGFRGQDHVFWDSEKHRNFDVILIVSQVGSRLEIISLFIVACQYNVKQLDVVVNAPLWESLQRFALTTSPHGDRFLPPPLRRTLEVDFEAVQSVILKRATVDQIGSVFLIRSDEVLLIENEALRFHYSTTLVGSPS